jgi:hypothetical protein
MLLGKYLKSKLLFVGEEESEYESWFFEAEELKYSSSLNIETLLKVVLETSVSEDGLFLQLNSLVF